MLIIAHRGYTENSPENSLDSLRAAIEIDADMIEVDIRLTKDRIPVLSHNLHLFGTRRRELAFLRLYTLDELNQKTAKNANGFELTTLEDALTICFGSIYLNLEIKEQAAVVPTLEVIKKFAHTKADWDGLLLSSFKPLVLLAIRREVPHAALGMLHRRNPIAFLGWHKLLTLSAVGFNRLYVNAIPMEAAKKLGLFTYIYTVNRFDSARIHAQNGLDGIVTDYPAAMIERFRKY